MSLLLLYEGLISDTDIYSGGISYENTNFPPYAKENDFYGFLNYIFSRP